MAEASFIRRQYECSVGPDARQPFTPSLVVEPVSQSAARSSSLDRRNLLLLIRFSVMMDEFDLEQSKSDLERPFRTGKEKAILCFVFFYTRQSFMP